MLLFPANCLQMTAVLQLAGLNSIESEIDIRKLLFLDRLLIEPKMPLVVKAFFSPKLPAILIQILSQSVFCQVSVMVSQLHLSLLRGLEVNCLQWNEKMD